MERYNVYRVETGKVPYRADTTSINESFDSHVVAVKQTYTSKFATDMKEIGKAYSPFIRRIEWYLPKRLRNATKEEIFSHYDNVEFLGE